MARIIPGVEVKVVKEVVPQQLSPSGVLGIVGFIDSENEANVSEDEKVIDVVRAGSWNSFLEECGSGAMYSLPEARQALENGVYELVIAPIPSKNKIASANSSSDIITFTARSGGTWANTISLVLSETGTEGTKKFFTLEIKQNGTSVETYKKVFLEDLVSTLAGDSNLVTAKINKNTGTLTDETISLTGGADGSVDEYSAALGLLNNEPDVDMVIAAVQDMSNADRVTSIYSKVISHCKNMSDECKGRIGFGQLPSGASDEQMENLAAALVSDRFVLLAPHGIAGSVAGMVGNLSYYESPTFKTLSGVTPSKKLSVESQRKMLKQKVVPVITQKGKGVIVVRGLTTDGDQINVRRIADRAVRGVKMIGDLFIGRLNTDDGRSALKQKLIEFLTQMERENAVVPSTDGSEPAFKVDVYSSQRDFALGIVRIDMAVRPVRAIDYIYATILVEV